MTNKVTVRATENLGSEFLHSLCQERSVDEDNSKRKSGFKAAIGSTQTDGRIVP